MYETDLIFEREYGEKNNDIGRIEKEIELLRKELKDAKQLTKPINNPYEIFITLQRNRRIRAGNN